MKIEGLVITCESLAELLVIAEGVDRLFQYMSNYRPGGTVYNLSCDMRKQLDEHLEKLEERHEDR